MCHRMLWFQLASYSSLIFANEHMDYTISASCKRAGSRPLRVRVDNICLKYPENKNLRAALGGIFGDKQPRCQSIEPPSCCSVDACPRQAVIRQFDFRQAWAEKPSIDRPVRSAKSMLTEYKANRLHNSCLQSQPSRSERSFHETHGECNRANYLFSP